MAVIGRIRKYSGLLVIVVGLALAGFVLQDFFRKSGAGRGRGMKDFSEAYGEQIAYRDFDSKVEEQLEQLKKQNEGQNVGADRINQIRQQVWNSMVRDIIMTKQYDKLGLAVTSDELYDLVQGKEPHQYILQSFSNPKTHQLERDRLNQFLHNFDQLQPDIKEQWVNLEKAIKDERINKKFNTLIENAYYVPKAFLERSYNEKNRKATFRFICLPYADIKDTNVAVSESDLKKYYDEHKYEYEQESPLRQLDYAVFDILPSAEDYKKAKEDIDKINEEFAKAEGKDIPNFVNSNSDAKYDSSFFAKGKLPVKIDSAFFKSSQTTDNSPQKTNPTAKNAKKKAKSKKALVSNERQQEEGVKIGTMIGPYIENNTYYLAKLVDVQNRPDSMRAKHILFAYQGALKAEQNIKRTKKEAKKAADSLLEVLKKAPDQFEAIAKKISDDPTAKEKGGDLGWFADGAMVYSFNQACLENNVGSVVVAESNYGYHIIEVTGKKDPVKKVRVAIIKRAIEASSKTVQDIYAKESRFTAENQTIQSFEKSVVKQGMNKRAADNVREMDQGLPGLEQAREVVRWAFDEKTKQGDVKDFELEGKYVVATLKGIKNKGIPKFDEIRNSLIASARKEKKAELLIKKIDDMRKSASTLEQLASKLNSKIDSAKDITFSSYSLPGTGPEPEVIGNVFSMKTGTMSVPIKGTKGVFVVMIDKIIESAPVKDYYRGQYYQLAGNFRQRASYQVYTALQKKADVVDNRRQYF